MHTNIYELERRIHAEIQRTARVYHAKPPCTPTAVKFLRALRRVSLAALFFLLGRLSG